jgi:hypothetical protein
VSTKFNLQNLLPFQATLKKMTADAIDREEAAMRIGAVAPDRLEWLMKEAQRRQEAHRELATTRGWETIATAGLDSVYEDVCRGRL